VDYNRLQIDGPVSEVMNIDPLEDKYRSFGWDVIRINGHDMEQIVDTLSANRKGAGKPLLVIAETTKGKGISFMENDACWHGKVPNHEEMIRGLQELGLAQEIPYGSLLEHAEKYQQRATRALYEKLPQFNRDYWWNSGS
jgi:transketolase